MNRSGAAALCRWVALGLLVACTFFAPSPASAAMQCVKSPSGQVTCTVGSSEVLAESCTMTTTNQTLCLGTTTVSVSSTTIRLAGTATITAGPAGIANVTASVASVSVQTQVSSNGTFLVEIPLATVVSTSCITATAVATDGTRTGSVCGTMTVVEQAPAQTAPKAAPKATQTLPAAGAGSPWALAGGLGAVILGVALLRRTSAAA